MTVEAGAHFEEIARGFYLEGLIVAGGDVWYTDVARGGVRRVGSDDVLLGDRQMIGGLLLNADGGLLVGGPGDITWVDPATGASGVLIDGIPASNEMTAEPDGGILFGTIDLPAILRGEKPGPSSIRRLSRDGATACLRDGLAFANGLAVTADGKTLFFNESFSATRAFPIAADGALGKVRCLADKPDCDGMALDAEGNVWITGFSSDHLLCLRPDGREVRRVPLPGKAATNVRFGGADLRDLYVNVVDPASAQALAEGTPLSERTSALYRTRSPVAGAPPATARFALAR